MLFPPSLDELIPEDDLARIVVDAVDQLDPSAMLATLSLTRAAPSPLRGRNGPAVHSVLFAAGEWLPTP